MDNSDENIFKILVATDNHLGYGEKDPIREQDSFITFEEILQLANKNDVDFILLGGDLFHDARPSPYCIHKCTELLRKYCLGDKPISIEFLSDMSCNFNSLKNPIVNYEDPNLNVSIPVFTIHGNHDDPIGSKQVSALDILATSGLVNYFGRWTDLTHVEIRPILLQKGETKLAIYGLSHIRDERLGRLFRNNKVTMVKPDTDGWFHILVLHQNRTPRGVKNFIPSNVIPGFIHLVIWGHEHDCRIKPEEADNFYISQPGSSVATSLSEGEAIPKKVALLKVHGKKFVMDYITLKTVRPFQFDNMDLIKPNDKGYNYTNASAQAEELVKIKILEMIENAKKLQGTNKPMLPLIRLRVSYYDEKQQFNPIRFGQNFTGKVANPDDIVLFKKGVKGTRGGKNQIDSDDDLTNVQEWASRVEDVVKKYFENDSKEQMSIMTVKEMVDSVGNFVDKNSIEAIQDIINFRFKKTFDKLKEMDPNVDDLEQNIAAITSSRINNIELQEAEIKQALNNTNRKKSTKKSVNLDDDDDESIENNSNSDSDVEFINVKTKATRGRGGRARGTPRRARGRGKK